MYCKKIGRGIVFRCENRESNHYGTDLEGFEELPLRGCEKIIYNGQKIPAFLFKNIPTDSYLRTIPLEQLVRVEEQPDLFNPQTDLTSKFTVQDLLNGIELLDNS